jgi:hypothetical protein
MSDERALNAANRHTTDHRQPRRHRPEAFGSYAGRVRRGQGPRPTARYGRGASDRDENGHEPGNRTVPAAHSKSKARPTNRAAEGAAIASHCLRLRYSGRRARPGCGGGVVVGAGAGEVPTHGLSKTR